MRKEKSLLLLLLLLKFALPFLLQNPAYELHRDEYLYYQQGQHLALGYLENPPLIGWLAFVSSLLGGGFFWVKFWPALFGAATLWVTVQIVKELGGGWFAQLLAALGILFSAYLRIHFLFQPNFLDIFFWTVSCFYLLRFLNTSNESYLFLLSAALALGWYSKYSVLFIVVSLILSFLLTQHRKVLTRRKFWQALTLGILLISPNLLWQYRHNLPLLHHMQELQETQLQYLSKTDFLKEQALMLLPVFFVWMGGLYWLLRHNKYRIIGYCFILVLLLLMLGSGKGYYALGVYPAVLAAGGVWAEKMTFSSTWLRAVFVSAILILSFVFTPILLPLQAPEKMAQFNQQYGLDKAGLLRWEDGKNHLLQQDFADMLGWKELTQKAESFFQQLPDSVKVSTIVYGRNYGLAGSMMYYANGEDFRKKVITDNGSFLLWIPNRLSFQHLLFIGAEMPKADDEVFQHFRQVRVVDSCTNPYSRQYGHKIIWFGEGSSQASILAETGLREKKQKFRR